MCLGIPMQVIETDGKTAVAEISGVRRKVSLDLVKDVKVGDYVIIHAGYAIQVMDKESAFETLRLLEELFSREVKEELYSSE